MKNICVFCGSSYGNNPVYGKSAKILSELFIKNNFTLIYGGGKVGLMGEIADQMLKSGGTVVGVIPEFLIKREVAHNGLSKLIRVNSMHERKEVMQKESDAFIAMPGGFGTIEEIFEMITWGQLNIHQKPCGLLNINGFYNYLDDFLENTVKEGFIEKEFKSMIIMESNPEKMIQKFLSYNHPTLDKAKIALSKNCT